MIDPIIVLLTRTSSACPGRFFASQEMKMFFAHVVLNYDVKLPGKRIKNFEVRRDEYHLEI